MSNLFRKTFKASKAFLDPADIYIIKKHDTLTCCQVNERDIQVKELFSSKLLCDYRDYTRIAKKKQFNEDITIECAADLVLVDGDVCDICELPRVIDFSSNAVL
jgi:hypothetical protein